MPQLGVELGRLFEVGFNIGVLTYIQQHHIQNRFGNFYQKELRELKLPKIMQKFYKRFNVINPGYQKTIEQWVIDIIQRGFLGGYNFFREYLASQVRDEKKVEILYYQCLFSGQNSLGTYPKEDNQALREILAQQQLPNDAGVIGRYTAKGNFLNADLLCWMVSRRRHHILSVDLSIFSVREMYDLADLNSVEVLRRLLARELNYIRSKSNFAGLSIDTRVQELPISKQFERYFKAFSREDKESSKLIQAAGYAHSFYTFLKEHHLLDNHPNRSVYFNVIGYTDRGMSAMALKEEQSELLATCGKIYQKKDDDSPLAKEKARNELKEARKKVIELIKSQAARSFRGGKAFFNQMLNYDYRASDGIRLFNISESLTDFINTADNIPADYAEQLKIKVDQSLRDAHAELITRALNSSASYIFLTGNPGIGKTTAITKFLQERIADGFLFLYVSPRTQVNLDIIEKFRVEEENREGWRPFCDDRLFLLNTNSVLIQRHGGQRDGQMSYTVGYYTNTRQGHFDQSSVRFIDVSSLDESSAVHQAKAVESVDEMTFKATKTTLPGVLASLCEALYVGIHDKLSSNLVAAISIQSLKKTSHDKDTLSLHFKKIFRDAYDDRAQAVRPSKMQAMSKRIKHIFVMIDEITGDEGGVAFLDGIRKELKKLELFNPKHGFNTKIIVADASIVDRDVISQHLSSTEPERDKIFFRKAKATAPVPLSYEEFTFRRRSPAIVINANSYPAATLHLNYKVFMEALQYSEETLLAKDHLASTVQKNVVVDILQLMRQPESDQLIVYMQDKLRLAGMIDLIRKERKAKREGTFEERVDYVQIHAELLDKQKKALKNCKEKVKVVFMTSSASRGLSFPKARHLLIVVPRFSIEQNLMEIIQVIYRGRGKEMDKKEKYLTFYLAERAIYDPKDEDYQLAIKERVLNVINLLLILKSSIMTRIRGYGTVGRKQYAIVPVGGKSVAAAGDTFSSKMSALIKALRKEQQKRPYDVALGDIRKKLETLLRDSDFDLYKKIAKSEEQLPQNYLNLLESFEDKVVSSLYTGFDKLLEVGPLQKGYISGNLLIIPLAEHRVEESIEMQLWNQIMPVLDDHLEPQMAAIAKNRDEYPDTLRTLMQQAVDLISELKKKRPDRSQRLEQSSSWDDLYLAIPLFTMVSREAFKTYFAKNPKEPEDNSFRDLLIGYVYSLYPADSFLPIGSSYGKFPFVIFRSYNLGEFRKKPFIDRYLLTSTELNVLNLILSN